MLKQVQHDSMRKMSFRTCFGIPFLINIELIMKKIIFIAFISIFSFLLHSEETDINRSNLTDEHLSSKLKDLEKDLQKKKEETKKLAEKELSLKSKLDYSSKRIKSKEKDLPIFEQRLSDNEVETLEKTQALDKTAKDVFIIQEKIKLQLTSLQNTKNTSTPFLPMNKLNSKIEIALLQEICKYDYEILKQLFEKKSNLENELAKLKDEKNDLLTRKRDTEYSLSKHAELLKQNKSILDNIKKEKKLTEKEIKELEEMQKQIAQLILNAQKMEGIPTETYKKILETNFELAKGLLNWPVEGEVTRLFSDKKKDDKYGLTQSNPGIDIRATDDSKVKSIAKGKVIYADKFKNYGNVIIVQHSKEYCSLYARLKDLYVHQGDIADILQPIGTLDISNGNGEYILHFEISKNGIPLDPLDWLRK